MSMRPVNCHEKACGAMDPTETLQNGTYDSPDAGRHRATFWEPMISRSLLCLGVTLETSSRKVFHVFSKFFIVFQSSEGLPPGFCRKYTLVVTDRHTKAVKSLRQILESIGTSLQACRALPRLSLVAALVPPSCSGTRKAAIDWLLSVRQKGVGGVPPPKVDCLDTEGTGTGTEP